MKRSDIREEFYNNLLDDGMMYIDYWAYEIEDDGSDITPEQRARLEAFTTADVARGWRLLLKLEKAGKFSCCGSPDAVRRSERSLASGDGGEDYDACVADAVIQLALLGDIVYG